MPTARHIYSVTVKAGRFREFLSALKDLVAYEEEHDLPLLRSM